MWNDKTSGQKQEKTEWHRIVLWGKSAESLSEYLTKGKQIFVEGRLQTRKWQDKDGHDSIHDRDPRAIGSRCSAAAVVAAAGWPAARHAPQRSAGAGAGSGGGGDHEPMGEPITDLTDDDIPF